MRISFLFLLSFLSINVTAASLNPISYGLRNAKDGKERFAVLMNCHIDAVKMGCDISYEGIDTLELEIPINSGSIPLPKCTDLRCIDAIGKHLLHIVDESYLGAVLVGINEVRLVKNKVLPKRIELIVNHRENPI